jgi:hypothetical protein
MPSGSYWTMAANCRCLWPGSPASCTPPPEQRQDWELIGRGEGLHWEELDEDISVAGLLAGRGDQTRRPPKAA